MNASTDTDSTPTCVPRPSPARILYAEDDTVVADFTMELLRAAGHEVAHFVNGAQAWSRFSARPEAWDLLLTDLQMPEMNGFELTHRVRALAPQVKIFVLSGHLNSREIDRFNDLQADEILAKPYRGTSFLQQLARLLAPAEAQA